MKQQVTASEFKAKCLALLDEVQRTRKELIVTKRGKPVAKVVPALQPEARVFGWMNGTVLYESDIISPTGEKWEADE